MWKDIGKKVKGLAKFICIGGIVISVLSAVLTWMAGSASDKLNTFFPGLLTLVVGSLLSWIGSWVTYAIGEACDRASEITVLNERVHELTSEVLKLKRTITESQPDSRAKLPEKKPEQETVEEAPPAREWKCSECGEMNPGDERACKKCGGYRFRVHS